MRYPRLAVILVLASARFVVAASSLPDLIATPTLPFLSFGATVDPGDVAEGCASAESGVDLLRFGVTIHNDGPAPFVLGDPQCPDCPTNPGAVCANPAFMCAISGGHGHAHYENITAYELLDGTGALVGRGGKRGFCLVDTACKPGGNHYNDCAHNQGLSPGCDDDYGVGVGCQYVEITGLPSGDYTLRITADPDALVAESDESNNVSTLPVRINRTPAVDQEMPGTRVSWRGGTLRFSSKAVTPLVLPDLRNDPRSYPSTLTIEDTGRPNGRFPLQMFGRWKVLGRPPTVLGFRFSYAGFGTTGCRVTLKPSGLSASCTGLGSLLPTPILGQLAVQLAIGQDPQRYCASFGGTVIANDATSFRAKNAPPAPCTTP